MRIEKRYITIKRPKGARKTFGLVWDIRSSDGTRSFETIESDRLDAINDSFLTNTLTDSEARTEIEKIKTSMLPQRLEVTQNLTNKKFVDKLISAHLQNGKRRKKESIEAIELDYRRILKLLGKDSVLSIDIEELQSRIISAPYSSSIQFRLIIFINKLLKFVGRKDLLTQVIKEYETRYLSIEELEILIDSLPAKEANVAKIFFFTGLRLGELFAIKKNKFDPKKREYKISLQLKEDLYYDTLKKLSSRTIKIPVNVLEEFVYFMSLTEDEIKSLRNKFSKVLLNHSRKIFDDESKHISAHDLRHSFAHHCLRKGISTSQIATSLGNSVLVVEKHYTSGTQHSSMLDEFEAKLLMVS